MNEPRANLDETAERVRAVIARTQELNVSDLRPEARLEADLGLDSLSQVELQMALEDEFGIELPDGSHPPATVAEVLVAVEDALLRSAAPTSGGGAP